MSCYLFRQQLSSALEDNASSPSVKQTRCGWRGCSKLLQAEWRKLVFWLLNGCFINWSYCFPFVVLMDNEYCHRWLQQNISWSLFYSFCCGRATQGAEAARQQNDRLLSRLFLQRDPYQVKNIQFIIVMYMTFITIQYWDHFITQPYCRHTWPFSITLITWGGGVVVRQPKETANKG